MSKKTKYIAKTTVHYQDSLDEKAPLKTFKPGDTVEGVDDNKELQRLVARGAIVASSVYDAEQDAETEASRAAAERQRAEEAAEAARLQAEEDAERQRKEAEDNLKNPVADKTAAKKNR